MLSHFQPIYEPHPTSEIRADELCHQIKEHVMTLEYMPELVVSHFAQAVTRCLLVIVSWQCSICSPNDRVSQSGESGTFLTSLGSVYPHIYWILSMCEYVWLDLTSQSSKRHYQVSSVRIRVKTTKDMGAPHTYLKSFPL